MDLRNLKVRIPDKDYCEECVKEGSDWVHLRKCQTCGKTFCCDSSPRKHARQHFEATGHPVVISAEQGERWSYCYRHELYNKISSF